MNLSIYNHVDPDVLAYHAQYTTTFFYIPETNDLLYDSDGQTHEDMLYPDEEGDDLVFDAVFPQYANLTSGKKRQYRSRGQALKHSKAILGRLGLYRNDFIVALWNPITFPGVNQFKKKLFEVFPQLKQLTVIMIGEEKKPEIINQGNQKLETPQEKPKNNKTYKIGDGEYTEVQLRDLRTAYHNKSMPIPEIKKVLCHPDIDKYPELKGYKLPACDLEKQAMKTSYRPANDYYANKYGEGMSFSEWLYS